MRGDVLFGCIFEWNACVRFYRSLGATGFDWIKTRCNKLASRSGCIPRIGKCQRIERSQSHLTGFTGERKTKHPGLSAARSDVKPKPTAITITAGQLQFFDFYDIQFFCNMHGATSRRSTNCSTNRIGILWVSVRRRKSPSDKFPRD